MCDDDLEMRDKYTNAYDLLDSVIRVICDAYPLKVMGPIHDVAGLILFEYFIEEDKPCQE